mgnify:CR=1 FL=1
MGVVNIIHPMQAARCYVQTLGMHVGFRVRSAGTWLCFPCVVPICSMWKYVVYYKSVSCSMALHFVMFVIYVGHVVICLVCDVGWRDVSQKKQN